MNIFLASVIVVALAGLLATHPQNGRHHASDVPTRPNRALVLCACAISAGAFVFQLGVLNAAAIAQRPLPVWLATLPVRVIEDRAPRFGHAPLGDFDALAAGLQTLGLILVYIALRGRVSDRISHLAIALTSAIMLACAFFAPAMTSFDMYAYAGTVHGGLAHAYSPSHVPFDRDWNVINRIYGSPIYPSAYGPAWIALSYVATSWITTLSGTIAGLRLIEACAFLLCLATLRRLEAPVAALALFALNPAILADSVAAGHNDLAAALLVLVAMLFRARIPIAIALAACAGAIKLPFLLIAPLAFVAETSTQKRVRLALATLMVTLGLYAIFGGHAYLSAIQQTAATYDVVGHGTGDGLRLAALLLVLAGIVVALLLRRFSPTLAWAFSALGVTFSSWYLVWGVPYALAERRWFPIFLISLPALAYLSATAFAATDFSVRAFYFSAGLAPALIILTLVRERRRQIATPN